MAYVNDQLQSADFREGVAIPWALELAWKCRQWNCLPKGGGVLDNDPTFLDLMELSERIYRVGKTKPSNLEPSDAIFYEQVREWLNNS